MIYDINVSRQNYSTNCCNDIEGIIDEKWVIGPCMLASANKAYILFARFNRFL